MDSFFSSNPGMGSRIAHHIDFPDYTLDELIGIACGHPRGAAVLALRGGRGAFREYLERRMKQPRFANGRSVRNALGRARLRQATRIVGSNSHNLTKEDLMCIEAEDILASRVRRRRGRVPGSREQRAGRRPARRQGRRVARVRSANGGVTAVDAPRFLVSRRTGRDAATAGVGYQR